MTDALRLRIAAQQITLPDGTTHPVQGLLLATVNRYPAFYYGDVVSLTAVLLTPPVFPDFDYRAYLASQNIHTITRRPLIKQMGTGQGQLFYHRIYAVRDRARLTIEAMLIEPHASLLSGLLLGLDGGIAEPVLARFNTMGTTHILVISGANFAVVAGVLGLVTKRLFRGRRGFFVALAGIWVYALLVGAEPAVVRAALMSSVYLWGVEAKQPAVALNSLAFAFLLLTLWNPWVLVDLGFQLSLMATLGLIAFVAPMTAWLSARLGVGAGGGAAGEWRQSLLMLMQESVVVTFAAQLMAVPLIAANFGNLSLVSPLTNFLILPVQGWLMMSGGLATLTGMVWLPLGTLLSVVPWALLQWTITMVNWTAQLPYASISVVGFQGGWVFGYYVILGLSWVYFTGWRPPAALRARLQPWVAAYRQQFSVSMLLGIGAVLAVVPWVVRVYLPDGRLHLYMLDVGQGDGLLIVTPQGRQVVIDGGPEGQTMLAALGPHMPPWDGELELLVLTHPDADHLGGLPDVLARYRVQTLLHPGTESTSALYGAWVDQVAREGARLLVARRGQQVWLEPGVMLEVLHPGPTLLGQGVNNDAVVLRLRYGGFCALLTGDIEAVAEAALVRSGVVGECGVLKVAHHGSRTSTTGPFLGASQPRVALISVGGENRYGHPAPEVVARLEGAGVRVWRTDVHGTVELVTDGARVWTRTERLRP